MIPGATEAICAAKYGQLPFELSKGFQAPDVLRCVMSQDVKVPIIRADFEERSLWSVPLVEQLVDHVLAIVNLEADRPLVRFPSRVAFN